MSVSEGPSSAMDAPAFSASVVRVAEILRSTVNALAAAGEVEKACRLAGQAYVALKDVEPAAARQFDALLHRLTPRVNW
ncbi:MAG TPA: hypothetical protein VK025_14120 [Steroidobacter sp.]|nr:hypothetical protein [Steroidobacteraceae bacterium]HLS82531.1 hypothetical protein [Steroidobacter sp.]